MRTLILVLALLLGGAPAYADRGSAMQVFGSILQAYGAFTGQPYLVAWGLGLAVGGVAGLGTAHARQRRRDLASPVDTDRNDPNSGDQA